MPASRHNSAYARQKFTNKQFNIDSIGVLIGAYSPAMASRCYIDEIISGGYRQIGVKFQSATTGMTVRKLTAHANHTKAGVNCRLDQ